MCLLTQRNVFSQFAFDLLTVIPTNSLLFTCIFPGNYLRFRFPNLNSDLICDSRDIPSRSAEFRELTQDFFLQQINLHPTRFNNILDLVFKNSPESVSNMSCMSPEVMGIYTDRCLLFFDFSKHVNSSGFYKRVTFSYRLADWDGLTEALTRVDLLPSDISDADVEAD